MAFGKVNEIIREVWTFIYCIYAAGGGILHAS